MACLVPTCVGASATSSFRHLHVLVGGESGEKGRGSMCVCVCVWLDAWDTIVNGRLEKKNRKTYSKVSRYAVNLKKNARVSREKRVFTVGAASGHAMPSPRTPPPKPARSARRMPARPCQQQVLWNVLRGRGVRAKKARNERRKERRYWPTRVYSSSARLAAHIKTPPHPPSHHHLGSCIAIDS